MSDLCDSPDQRRRDYIVAALREAGAMYEGDARSYLAEHDTAVRAEALTAPTCVCMTPNEFVYHCVCREDPTAGPAHKGHAKWCPASKPTPERITQIRQGIGDELTQDELAWLKGAAGRHELHITGGRGGHWPMRDLPGGVLLLAQYLAAAVAVIERVLPDEAVEKDSAPAPTSTPQPEATPLVIRWDRTVIHPEADPTDDTIVCCLTEDGHPVALFLDDEHREALGLMLVDPNPDSEATDAPPALDLVDRQQHLLAVICRKPRARWATGRVEALYRDWGVASPRSTGRSDLQDLHRLGHLTPHGPEDGRFYLLRTDR